MTAAFERTEHAKSVVMDGEWMIVEAERGVVAQVNEFGGFVWECLEKQALDIGQLTEAVQARYEIGREAAERDVAFFLQQLAEIGFVRSKA